MRQLLSSKPLPLYLLKEDGSLSALPAAAEQPAISLDRSLITFTTPGTGITGTLLIPTEMLNAFISDLVTAKPAHHTLTTPTSVSLKDAQTSLAAPAHRGGAPPKHDAEALLIEVFRLLYSEGFQPKTQAELRQRALDRYWERQSSRSAQSLGPPSDEWAKRKIRNVWNELGLDPNG